jgi:soluble lytic murein transglycosylase-like protein
MQRRCTGKLNWKRVKRNKEIHRTWNRYRIFAMAAGLAVTIAFLLIVAVNWSNGRRTIKASTVEAKTMQVSAVMDKQVEQRAPTAGAIKKISEYENAFNTSSLSEGMDDLSGFLPYEIPKDFTTNGGYFPECIQKYTYILCRQAGVDYETVLGLIEVESSYKWDSKSRHGAVGYMQIVKSSHTDRMERLGITDLYNPYQNIETGVDYLKELVEKYNGDYDKVLTAYRWGTKGAYRDYFSKGEYTCSYSELVQQAAGQIRDQIGVKRNDGTSWIDAGVEVGME